MTNTNNIGAKLETLSRQLEERKEKALKNARIAAIVFGILVIFVFGYTTFIFNQIEGLTTNESISGLISSKVSDTIPKIHDKIVEYSHQQVPELTEKLIKMAHDNIPTVEDYVKKTIDKQVESFIAETKKDIFPELMEVLRGHSKDFGENAKIFTDETAAKELIKIISSEFEQKIDYDIIGDEFFGKFHDLRRQLDELATKPVSEMTRKEMAERNAVMNWMYLISRGESLQSIFAVMISNVAHTSKAIFDGSFFTDGGIAPAEVEPPPAEAENPDLE